MTTLRHSSIVGLAIVAIACAPIGCGNSAAGGSAADSIAAKPAAAPVPVTVGDAQRRDFQVAVSAIGWVEPFATVVVKPQVAGQLQKIAFREGDEVKAGAVLMKIDARPFEAALRLAESSLARDQAMATDARREATRMHDLAAKGQASDRERDQTEADAAAKEAQVRARAAEVEQARLNLEYCTIRSPMDARAGAYLVNRGNVVKENETELVVLNQLSPIHVAFSVPERYLAAVRAGQVGSKLAVVARPTDSDEPPLAGELQFIDNQVDRNTGTVKMKATFANLDKRLWPGRFVKVELSLTTMSDVVVVPSSAVQPGQKGSIIFVVDESGAAQVRSIEPGLSQGGLTVVARGLSGGERVVTDGQLRLTPGAKVSFKNAVAPPTAADAAEPASQPASQSAAMLPARD